MPALPVVAIIGRPNVGKSSIFNCLLGERVSIEEPTEGVTRDRIMRDLELAGTRLRLVDTGGIGVVDRQNLESEVEDQISAAIGMADLIMFIVDAMNSATELDRRVASRLHRTGLPCLLVANKADNDEIETEALSLRSLGFGAPISVSVLHKRGISGLCKALAAALPFRVARHGHPASEGGAPRSISLALVGRRNVGKSSFVNLLCGEKRVIVSDEPGTTRDAIDVLIEREGKHYTLIDTAGLRKKSQLEDSIEFFSVARTFGALMRADAVLYMLDSQQGVSQVDQKLGRWILDHHKPCVIVVNKWDLAEGVGAEEYERYTRKKLAGMGHVPFVVMSVLKNRGVEKPFRILDDILLQKAMELPTPRLNRILEEAQERRKPKSMHGVTPKLFYVTALPGEVPTLLIFGKGIEQIQDAYKRYLAAFFREKLEVPYLPIRFVFRKKESRQKEP